MALASINSGVRELARVGAIVGARAGVRPSAVAEIETIASRLAEGAVPPFRPFDLWKARLATPQLRSVGASDAMRAAEDLRGLVRWVDDGDCLARAVVGAARIDELLGGLVTGPNDAVRAAVAIVNTSQRRTGWVFHAATAFRSAEDDGVRIVDHLLGARVGNASGIFTVDDWATQIGRTADDVRIQSKFDNVPVAGNVTIPATARTMRLLGKRLVGSITDA